jgi:hypothetical protein
VSNAHIGQLVYAVRGIETFAGRTLCTCDFTPELINAYLRQMKCDGRSDEYRKSRRGNLLTIWDAAADRGMAPEFNRRKIMRIVVRDRLPSAWTLDEVRHLLSVAKLLRGTFHHVPKRVYWPSYIASAWDTGLRGVDLRSFERTWLRPSVVIVQKKTGKRIRIQFRQSTLDLIRASFPPDRALIWPCGCIRTWREEASLIISAAGLEGTIGRLRHSSGTRVEVDHPGFGHQHLGNGEDVFRRHYFDQSHQEITKPMPTEL